MIEEELQSWIDNGGMSDIDGKGLGAIRTRWVLTYRMKAYGATPDRDSPNSGFAIRGDLDLADMHPNSPPPGGRTSGRAPRMILPLERTLGVTGDSAKLDVKTAFLRPT